MKESDRNMQTQNYQRVYNGIERPFHTPDAISSLKPDEVFVFGSNLQGRHGGGAARVAQMKSELFGDRVSACKDKAMPFQPCKVVSKPSNPMLTSS